MLMLLASVQAAQVELLPDEAKWQVGVTFGAGTRLQPVRAIPDGTALRLDLYVLTVQRARPMPHELGPDPARLELQIDPVHLWATHGATTSPRLPLTLYATWLHPFGRKWHLTMSPGVYATVGWDSLVKDETLRHRPGGTLAASGRVGLERQRWLWPAMAGSWGLRTDLGVAFSADPDTFATSRYLRFGLERTLTWGRR
ncbi:MAG: hypothetical protein GY884_35620 [Proteobacteria bacterium]|nr:hypothetical protein [Pseudomonadota bacterium]